MQILMEKYQDILSLRVEECVLCDHHQHQGSCTPLSTECWEVQLVSRLELQTNLRDEGPSPGLKQLLLLSHLRICAKQELRRYANTIFLTHGM